MPAAGLEGAGWPETPENRRFSSIDISGHPYSPPVLMSLINLF